jgi:undecaprenyl pyrophosphate phosphatase UppP
MLPLSFLSSYFGYKSYTITTKDILAIMFIFIGGILPASEGKLGVIFNKQFWNNKAVKYCIIAELMVSIYGLWVYQIHNGFIISPIIYFGLSRIGNFLMCCIIGLWLSTLSYGICREPSIVNATEGGLQQFLNLGFSLI